VLEYIAAGDIFQANLTHRHQAARPVGLEAWAVYGALRARNPAPFGAWLRCRDHDLCCSSPERFLRLTRDGAIQTRPIKGTIARDADAVRDAAAAAALAASAKDRAENVMIVDVLRNDLGRVAIVGSVAVPALCVLESYATVHHLVSTVTARLRPGLGPIDLLRAALPGGSITGAPKVRAMQIIAELETARRGPYCGCVAWIGFDGAMDSNIVIRSLVLTPRRVIAQSGGGIVADSQPGAEYEEMMLKSGPMRDG
jgi:para-aminobenzoate synthetase component 1